MGTPQLSESEKDLLNILGKHPDMPLKELVNRVKYKRANTVIKKIEKFKKQGFIYGPFHGIDYSKLCKNPLRLLFCIMESSKSYETVISYLKLIEPLIAVYPVLSPRKELINTQFLSSDHEETESIFQLLKDTGIITDYSIRISTHKRAIENPNFFGDPNPSLDNLLDPCDVPDMTLQCHDTNWNECDISILNYFRTGYKDGRLIEILRAEKKLNKPWTYEQIKNSHRKMIKNGLIRKEYLIFPFPFDQCTDFNLYLKTEDTTLTQRIIYNFARGERVSREYMFCGDWGYIGFASHPQFLTGLMYKLNKIDEIVEKEIYPLRSTPDRRETLMPFFLKYSAFVLKSFDFDNQTLEYPYWVYKEKIKEKIEKSSNNC